MNQDAHAFAEFIVAYLSKYGRWNSPKYLFGESYGTPRSAVLSNLLEQEYNIDLNGVMLLSQILNFDLSVDGPENNPGIELPYVVALPTYAATAWYHHKLPGPNIPTALEPFVKDVEDFAIKDYAHALAEGVSLPKAERQAMAEKLHGYTAFRLAISSRPICASTAASSRRTSRTIPTPPPAGSTRVSLAPRWNR